MEVVDAGCCNGDKNHTEESITPGMDERREREEREESDLTE